MPRIAVGSGLVVLVFTLIAGTVPTSAEFFGCNDQHSARTVSYRSYQRAPSYSHASRYTHEFAAQPRHSRVTYDGGERYRHERSRW